VPLNQSVQPAQSLIIVTGLSGAGKSVVINALEDLGFYCIDNLPLELLDAAVFHMRSQAGHQRHFTIGLDVRNENFVQKFIEHCHSVRQKIALEVLFLTADDEYLLRRYSATRRPHPLAIEGTDLLTSIRAERKYLAPIEEMADNCIDTSALSPHDLTRMIEKRYQRYVPPRKLSIVLTSFGFQNGLPRQMDSLFDMRCLPNPHYIPELRDKTGKDSAIQEYLANKAPVGEMIDNLSKLLLNTIPLYYDEGKHYFRIAIGCTGGKHRSVYVVERLAEILNAGLADYISLNVEHRDIQQL
jgi:RNase adapter protein RapZ